MGDFRVDDESGDKKYFTMVPNYVLNHSGAIEQGLYLQMKRYAGENGSCFASGKTLRKKLKIGKIAYRKAVDYLLEHEWIYKKGAQMVETAGGPQMVTVYGVRDLWKLNSDFYDKGGAKSAYLPKGGPKNAKGGSETAPKKNIIKTQEDELAYAKTKEKMRKKFGLPLSSEGSERS